MGRFPGEREKAVRADTAARGQAGGSTPGSEGSQERKGVEMKQLIPGVGLIEAYPSHLAKALNGLVGC
jgi:hypothetical protein